MPERKLIWSPQAFEDMEKILAYFEERNGSSEYGNKLLQKIEKRLKHYLLWPQWGQRDGKSRRRFFVCENYSVYYRFTKTVFEVIKVWDGRRDPKTLKLSR